MKQLLLDWTTQSSPNDNRTSSEPLLNLLIDDGALRSQFNMVVGDGIGGGGTRQIFTNPDDAAVLALAAEPVEENNNHVHSRKDASLSSSEGDNPPSIQISDVEYWDAGFSKRIKSVLNLLVKTFPQTSSKNADLNELILSCLS